MTAPQTVLDLQVILVERCQLKPDEFERLFSLTEKDGKLIVAKRKDSRGKFVWVDSSTWNAINDYVKGLGGAWSSLEGLWEIQKAPSQKTGLISIFIDSLMSLPFQVRSWDSDPELAEMAETIKSHGLLEPIVVRSKGDKNYEVVNGERRLKASKLAGLTEVLCVVKSMSDQEAYECQMIENIQRKDLSDGEKAHWLKHMLEKFPETYPTHEALAKRIGKSRAWVSQLLRAEPIVTRVTKETGQELTEHQAREILATPPEKRDEVIQKVVEKVTAKPTEEPLPDPVECELCGVETHFPIMFNDKPFCCEEHLERAREAGKLKAPSVREIKEIREEVTESKPHPLLSGFKIECQECHVTLLIEHQQYPDGKTLHKIVGEKHA